MKKTGFIILLLGMLVGACKSPYKEPEVPQVAEQTIKVRTEDFSPGELHFYWTAHDSLAVYTGAHPAAEPFKLTSGGGQYRGTIHGENRRESPHRPLSI